MARWVGCLEYKGSRYYGWQMQQEQLSTIQHCVDEAIARVANEQVTTFCAGRTDKGVHATAQIIHFDAHHKRQTHQWLLGVNSFLPPDIRFHWFKEVCEAFHARFSAVSRRYCYIIANTRVRPALFSDYLTWYNGFLDIDKMIKATHFLLGEHDFTSYRASQCQALSPIRTINHLEITRNNSLILIDIEANGFLHHMIRNIVGVLLTIGSGKKQPEWADEVLQARNRSAGDVTAKANGLYFIHAGYPDKYQLGNEIHYPLFIPSSIIS